MATPVTITLNSGNTLNDNYSVVTLYKYGDITAGISGYEVTLKTPDIFTINQNGNSTAVTFPLNLNILRAASTLTIRDSSFNRMVLVKFEFNGGLDTVTFDTCTFKCSGIDGDPAVLSINGENKQINLTNVDLKFKRRSVLVCQENNTFDIQNSNVDILPDEDINLNWITTSQKLTNLFNNIIDNTTNDYAIGNKTRLDNDSSNNERHNFLDFDVNYTFYISNNRDVNIWETVFNRSVKYIFYGGYNKNLNFHSSTFNTSIDTYLGESEVTENATGRVIFSDYSGSQEPNKFFPTFNQVNGGSGSLWNTLSSLESKTANEEVFVNIYLVKNSYPNIQNLTYFKQATFLPLETISSNSDYVFATTNNKLNQLFRFGIDSRLNNSDGVYNSVFATFISNASVSINNTRSAISLNLGTNTVIKALENEYALINSGKSNSDNINLGGIYENNIYNIIDTTFTVGNSDNNDPAKFYYTSTPTGTTRIDTADENEFLLAANSNLYVACENFQLYVRDSDNITDRPTFTIPSTASAPITVPTTISFNKSAFLIPVTFVMNKNVSMVNSYIGVDTDGFLDLSTPTTESFTLSNSVVELSSQSRVIGNLGTGSHSFSGNTFNVNFTNVNLSTIGCDLSYFNSDNIINVPGNSEQTITYTLLNINSTNSSSLRLACNNDSTFYINDANTDREIVIYGDKLTTDEGYFVQATGSSGTLTLQNFTFKNKSSGEYINYMVDNNDFNQTNNIVLVFSDVEFYINSSTKSINTDYTTTDQTSGPVYIVGSGFFKLGSDPIVVYTKTVNLETNNDSQTATTLGGTTDNLNDANSVFDGRLTVNFLAADTQSGIFNMNIRAKGLDLNDTVQSNHTINLGSNTLIDVTNSSFYNSQLNNNINNAIAVNFGNNTTSNGKIEINGGTYRTINNVSVFYIGSSEIQPTQDIKLTVGSGVTLVQTQSTQVRYYVYNAGTMLLKLDNKPVDGSVERNLVYWPTLTSMNRNISTPLEGSAVLYGESWDITNVASLKNYVNDVNNGASGLNQGLRLFDGADQLNLVNILNLTVNDHTWDTDINSRSTNDSGHHLDWIIVYSKEAIETAAGQQQTLNNILVELNKDYTNDNTNHTGRLHVDNSTFGVSKSYTDTGVNGWILSQVYFNDTRMVVMPYSQNTINMKLTPRNSNSTPLTSQTTLTWDKTTYSINTDLTINNQNTWDYLYNNCKRTVGSSISTNKTDGLEINNPMTLNDNGNQVTATEYKEFKIKWVMGNDNIYFLTDVKITVSAISTNGATDISDIYINNVVTTNASQADNITYDAYIRGIDNNVTESETFVIQFLDDPDSWTWKTIQILPILTSYTDEQDAVRESVSITNNVVTIVEDESSTGSGFQFVFENIAITNTNILAIVLSNINDVVSDQTGTLIATTTQEPVLKSTDNNYFTVTQTNNKRTYEWTGYIAVIILATAGETGSPNYDPNTRDTDLRISEETSGSRGTTEFTKYVYDQGTSTWIVANDNNITEYDTIIRYKVKYVVTHIRDQYVDTTYTLTHQLQSISPFLQSDESNLKVSINNFIVPLLVDIRTATPANVGNSDYENTPYDGYITAADTDDIYTGSIARDTFDLSVVFSAKIQEGSLMGLKFLNDFVGTASPLIAANTYNMDEFINGLGNQLYKIDNNQESVNTSTFYVSDVNNVSVSYRLNISNYSLGTFRMVVDINSFIINNTPATPSKINGMVLTYTEVNDRKPSIKVRVDKVLDATNYEYIPSLNVKPENSTANEFNVIATSNIMVPAGFNNSSSISSTNLKPFNKFTQYYLSLETSSLSFKIDPNGQNTDIVKPDSDTSEKLKVSLIFKDASDNIVNDIECYKWTKNVGPGASVTEVVNNYLNTENFFPNIDDGNTVLFFRRKINPLTPPEQNYDQLKVYIQFANVTDTNYANLSTSETLVGTIDYSNYGLTTINASQITIGNWRIVPSGDGKTLLFRNVTDGSNPNNLAIDITSRDQPVITMTE